MTLSTCIKIFELINLLLHNTFHRGQLFGYGSSTVRLDGCEVLGPQMRQDVAKGFSFPNFDTVNYFPLDAMKVFSNSASDGDDEWRASYEGVLPSRIESTVSFECSVGGCQNRSGLFGKGKSLARAWIRTHDFSVLQGVV